MYQQGTENDELRARFTKWMKVVAYRTRRGYLKGKSKVPQIISLEEVPEGCLAVMAEVKATDTFDFEENRVALAFSQLPASKREVLTMLFVLEESPEEIAGKLGCTVQNVYNQRSQALNRLRAALKGGEGIE